MNHEYFKDRVSAFHDGELKHEEERMIAEHIQQCEECQKLLADLEKLDLMVSERSGLGESDYWEKSAQKIEAALGVKGETEVVEVRRGSYRGLWWKISAVAASAAVIAFIALYQGDISRNVFNDKSNEKTSLQKLPQVRRELDTLNELVPARLPSRSGDTGHVRAGQLKKESEELSGKVSANGTDKSAGGTAATTQSANMDAVQSESENQEPKPSLPPAAELKADEKLMKKTRAVPQASGEIVRKDTVSIQAMNQAPGVVPEPQKLKPELELSAPDLGKTTDVNQLNSFKDSLEKLVAEKRSASVANFVQQKGKGAMKATSELQADPDSLLILTYYRIATVTSDSVAYQNAIDSLSAISTRTEGRFHLEADSLLNEILANHPWPRTTGNGQK